MSQRKGRVLSFAVRSRNIWHLVQSFFAGIKARFLGLKKKAEPRYQKTTTFIKKRPIASFAIALFILFLTIFLNSLIGQPPKVAQEKAPVKEVSVYKIGKAPTLTVSAQVEKSGVVKIVAQTAGVVSQINFTEGQEIPQGAVVMSLAQNYSGGNSASVSRQLAQVQYTNVKETYDLQKDIIKKQKEVAEKIDANADQLRDITDKSINETNDIINLNSDMLSTIDANLAQLEATNVGGANDEAIFMAKQLKSQLLSGNSQLRQASRSAQFQSAGDKPPAELSNLQKDLAIKQLEVQEKALDVSKETSRLQLLLAQMGESMFYPTAPFLATVERINVVPFQSITPGMTLATLSGTNQTITAIAKLPKHVASNISRLETSTMIFGSEKYQTQPSYIASEATDGQLYGVLFDIPANFQKKLTNAEFVRIEIPVGYADTSESVPFLPIDAIFQTQDEAYVYVVKDKKAMSKKVTLGNVFGRFVEVKNGLNGGDQVIVTRNVIDGDSVQIQN